MVSTPFAIIGSPYSTLPPRMPDTSKYQAQTAPFLQQWLENPLYSTHPDQLKVFWQRMRVFNEMRQDTLIAGAQLSIKMPLLAADFRILPGDTSSDSKKMAECVERGMGIHKTDSPLSISWIDHVEQALTCMDFGFSMIERVAVRMEEGEIGFKELNHIPAIMLDPSLPWIVFDGKLIGIMQNIQFSMGIHQRPVAYDRLLHFQYQTRNYQPDGESPNSAVWRDWRNRVSLEQLEMIGIEQDTGGTPIVYCPTAASQEDIEDILEQIEQVRRGFRRGIVVPGPKAGTKDNSMEGFPPAHSWLIEPYMGQSNSVAASREVITSLDKRILLRYLAQFLSLGQDATGSFALANASMNFFALSMKMLQKKMLSVWQRKGVNYLYDQNKAKWPSAKRPRIYWNPVQIQDIQTLTDAYTALVESQVLKPTEDDTDFWRSITGTPEEYDGTEYLEILEPLPGAGANGSGGAGNGGSVRPRRSGSRNVAGEPQGGSNRP